MVLMASGIARGRVRTTTTELPPTWRPWDKKETNSLDLPCTSLFWTSML